MNQLDYINFVVTHAADDARRANDQFVAYIRRIADDLESMQTRFDEGETPGVVDAVTHGLTWIESIGRQLRDTQARYEKALAVKQAVDYLAWEVATSKVSLDEIQVHGLDAKKGHDASN